MALAGWRNRGRPEQHRYRAVNLDPLTGKRERQPPEASVTGGVDEQARDPGQRHQQGSDARQQAKQQGLVWTGQGR